MMKSLSELTQHKTLTLMDLLYIALLATFSLCACSCSLLMSEAAVTDAHPTLNSNSKREQIIKVLGKPSSSHLFTTPREAKNELPYVSPQIAKMRVSGYDDFVISGLVNTERYSDGTAADGLAIYGFFTVATGGLFELLATPTVAYNLAKEKQEKFNIRVWYDTSQHYLAHKKTPVVNPQVNDKHRD